MASADVDGVQMWGSSRGQLADS